MAHSFNQSTRTGGCFFTGNSAGLHSPKGRQSVPVHLHSHWSFAHPSTHPSTYQFFHSLIYVSIHTNVYIDSAITLLIHYLSTYLSRFLRSHPSIIYPSIHPYKHTQSDNLPTHSDVMYHPSTYFPIRHVPAPLPPSIHPPIQFQFTHLLSISLHSFPFLFILSSFFLYFPSFLSLPPSLLPFLPPSFFFPFLPPSFSSSMSPPPQVLLQAKGHTSFYIHGTFTSSLTSEQRLASKEDKAKQNSQVTNIISGGEGFYGK